MAVLTTGGTYDYQQSAVQIVTAALRICQVIGEEDTASGIQLETAMDALNAMAKGWQAAGIHLWLEEEGIIYLQPGQQLYQLASTSPDNVTLYNSAIQNSLAATAAASATTLALQSAAGIVSGDNIGIQLDAGTNFWTTVNGTPSGNNVTITAGRPSQASALAIVFDYTTPLARPLRVYTGRRFTYNGKLEVPMITLSRTDWANLPNKYNTGLPTQYYFDPQTGQGAYQNPTANLYFWPTPQDDSVGFRFTAQRPIQDFVTLANVPDFPVEWTAALKWNLAMELTGEYGVPPPLVEGIIQPQAAKWYGIAQAWDREPQSVLFGVAFQPGYHNG